MTPALAAFVRADFDGTGDLWTDAPHDVEGLHTDFEDGIAAEFSAHADAPDAPPLGLILMGDVGSGKTHLLSALRRRVLDNGGGFVSVDVSGAAEFWPAVALGFAGSLARRTGPRTTQAGAILLAALKSLSGDPAALQAGADARLRLAKPGAVELLLAMLATRAPENPDVVRALSLLDSQDPALRAFATQWLQGGDGEEGRGFLGAPPAPAEIVQGLLEIMTLGGPAFIAVEGLETAPSERLAEIADGLAALRDAKPRALTLIACLPPTWDRLKSLPALADRFRPLPLLAPVSDAGVVERLISARLAPAYSEAGFAPPYPTYPFPPAALDSAVGLHPGVILARCRDHANACVATGAIRESASLAAPDAAEDAALDAAFAHARARPAAKEGVAALLAAACELYLRQLDLPPGVEAEAISAPDPALHASLAFVFPNEGGRRLSFGFHAIAEDDPAAFRSRLAAAMAAADLGAPGRSLIVLSANPPPLDALQALEAGCGRILAPAAADLAGISALRRLEGEPGFEAWLRRRKPLFKSALFRAAGLASPDFLEPGRPGAADAPRPNLPPPIAPAPTPPAPALGAAPDVSALPALASREPPARGEIYLGRSAQIGAVVGPLTLSTTLLPRHIAVFGELGAGKSVFLSRIVEEAAILGVPAVVLDGDNRLARLGEPWPSRPTDFSDDDARKAKLFFDQVEVVVWTPGVSGGRSFSLPILPDFAAFGRANDPESLDERERAVELAVATLDPYLPSRGAKAIRLRGALADGLRAFGRAGGGSFDDLLRLLSDLPASACRSAEAPLLAREIVMDLAAAIATEQFSTEQGPPFDPGQLFLGDTRKTRVSVVNLSGLPSDAARAAFVNQLQMTLYFWIKRHPSPTARLYVVEEAHRYAPAKGTTPAKRSALALSRQARKYGLSMIWTTERPRDLDPGIVSNCLTHVYGRVGTPADLSAVAAMMTAKGGAADDVAALRTGEFYYASEGIARPIKIRAPLCLSRRSPNPPTAAEVSAIARRGGEVAAPPLRR